MFPIFPQETELVLHASQKRKREFHAGRYCAHELLTQFGLNKTPVMSGYHREPVWPSGIVGSISHCKDIAGAIMSRDDIYCAIGLDIENIKPMKQAFANYICSAQELELHPTITESSLHLLMLFSVKESVYKAVFAASGIKLTLKQCHILDISNPRAVVVKIDNPEFKNNISVQVSVTNTHILSVACIN